MEEKTEQGEDGNRRERWIKVERTEKRKEGEKMEEDGNRKKKMDTGN